MKYFNDELQKLQEQSARKKHLESTLKGLYDQQREIQDHLRELKQISYAENADVEKLEKFSLAGLYYLITNQKEEMLNKERQEAYTARLKCDAAQTELDTITEEIIKAKQLFDAGVLTEQEFADLKAKLIAKL